MCPPNASDDLPGPAKLEQPHHGAGPMPRQEWESSEEDVEEGEVTPRHGVARAGSRGVEEGAREGHPRMTPPPLVGLQIDCNSLKLLRRCPGEEASRD